MRNVHCGWLPSERHPSVSFEPFAAGSRSLLHIALLSLCRLLQTVKDVGGWQPLCYLNVLYRYHNEI